MITNHEKYKCKECKEKLSTFMELLQHVAKHHSKDIQEKDVENKHTQNEKNVKREGVFCVQRV